MNPMNTVYAAIIVILFTMVFIIVYPQTCKKSQEGFATSLTNISSCPSPTKSMIDKNGITICCDGGTTGHECDGKIVCAISLNHNNIPMCSTMLTEKYNKKGKEICPNSMPNYYVTSTSPGNEMCTSSPLNRTLDGPLNTGDPTCSIGDYYKDSFDQNSCVVQRLFDATMCPTNPTPCTKTKISHGTDKPVLIQVSFVDSDGISRTCSDDTSLHNYYVGINKVLNKNNINLCSIAKKVYVDKTMNINETVN
jgi:hypothetical protein